MKQKISSITLFTALTIACVFSGIILWNMQSIFTKFSEKNKAALRAFYTDQQKELIKNEVERMVKRIYAIRTSVTKSAMESLKDQVRSAEDFIQNVHVNHKGAQYGDHIRNMINSFNWNRKAGYFYIMSGDGTIRYHGARPELVDKNIYSLETQFPDLIKFLENTKANGSATGQYDFYRPGRGDNHYQKLGYARYNKTFDMIIGTGYYLESLVDKVKQEVLGFITDERFGYQNYGYFWVVTTSYKMIFHIDPSLYNIDLRTYKDAKDKFVFKDFVDIAKTKGSGFSSYYWNIPGQAQSAEKISYLLYIPDWDWIVGAGFYFENFHELVQAEEEIGSKLLKHEIIKNILIILLLFISTLAVSLMIYKRIRKIEYEQEIFVNDLLQYRTVIDTSAIVSITDLGGESHPCE